VHLVIHTQYYPPEIGAPQRRLSALAQGAARRGHRVTVLTAMPNYPTGRIHEGYGGLARREHRDGVDIVRTFIYPTQRANLVPRLLNYFSFVVSSAVLGSMMVNSADYWLVESPPLFLGLSGLWLSCLKRARLIFNVSDLWPESAVRLGVLDLDSHAFRWSSRLEALCYQRAWLVSGQSQSTVSSINERFPQCFTYHFSNGVDTQVFGLGRATVAARSTLLGGSEDGRFVALYAGLHGLAQGLEQILEVAKAFRGDPNLSFVLVGDGPEKSALMDQAAEANLANVRFLDPFPASEIPALLAAADTVLVPLKRHIPGAVPSKLYEAMASQRPTVLLATGEPADLVRRNQAGIVVNPGDIESLAAALRKLQASPELRQVYGENGRKAAERHFDRGGIVDRFLDLLEEDL
jgi:colanic acid biosynthesis glycosyl transferase WcaI